MSRRIALLVLLWAAPAFATDYHVDPTGNNGNACTSSGSSACATIAGALAKITSGTGPHTITVAAGTYTGEVDIAKSGLDADNRIVIRGHDGTGCPTTANSDPHAPPTRPAPTVTISGGANGFDGSTSHVTIDCFKILPVWDGLATGGRGIKWETVDEANLSFINNWIEGDTPPLTSGASGCIHGIRTFVAFAVARMPENLLVQNNYIKGCHYGLYLSADGALVTLNELDILTYNTTAGSDSDYSRVYGDAIVMSKNYFHDANTVDCAPTCHTDCVHWGASANAAYEVLTAFTFTQNTCFNSHQGIIARDQTAAPDGPTVRTSTMMITNNVFAHGPDGDEQAWCVLFDGITGPITFAHNTCYNTNKLGFRDGTTAVVRNNIYGFGVSATFVDTVNTPLPNGPGGNNSANVTNSDNLLYRIGTTFVSVGNVVNVDPLFVNRALDNFDLGTGSPAIGVGADLSITVDRDGVTRTDPYDVGAYEGEPPLDVPATSYRRPRIF